MVSSGGVEKTTAAAVSVPRSLASTGNGTHAHTHAKRVRRPPCRWEYTSDIHTHSLSLTERASETRSSNHIRQRSSPRVPARRRESRSETAHGSDGSSSSSSSSSAAASRRILESASVDARWAAKASPGTTHTRLHIYLASSSITLMALSLSSEASTREDTVCV